MCQHPRKPVFSKLWGKNTLCVLDWELLILTVDSNFIVAGTMEIIGEAQVLAEKSDLGTGTLEKLLELNFGSLMHSTSTRMTQGVYLPGEGMYFFFQS